MASLLIFFAIVAFVTVSFPSARRWLLVGSLVSVASFTACGLLFCNSVLAVPNWLLAGEGLRGVSQGSGVLPTGVFGRLNYPCLFGCALVAIIAVWMFRVWMTWTRGNASETDRIQTATTWGVLAVLAWVCFSYEF